MAFYPEMSLFEITVVPLNEGGPFVEGSPICEVTLKRRCHLMESAPLWEVPLFGKYPFMRSALLWKLWEPPLYENSWEMHLYEGCVNGMCSSMESALL